MRVDAQTAVSPTATTAPAADSFPIVDAHHHLYESRNQLIPQYKEAVKGLGVEKSIYAETMVRGGIPAEIKEADFVLGVIKESQPIPSAATIGGLLTDPGFAEYARRYKGSPYIKGIRQIVDREPAGESHSYRKPEFIKSVQLLGELDLEFDICPHPAALDEAVPLIKACPNTRFVLTHCANPDTKAFNPATRAQASHDPEQWKRAMEAVAKAGGDRIICKISHFIVGVRGTTWSAADLAPIVNHALDTFGPERCVWGSDWPTSTSAAPTAAWFNAFKEIIARRPRADQVKVLHDTAVRFYKLA
jgi:predicted TIM-barrel fold metal-dependent hydrolase